jgi:hypothetical protein
MVGEDRDRIGESVTEAARQRGPGIRVTSWLRFFIGFRGACRGQPKNLELLIAGDKDLAIRDHRHQICIAGPIGPASGNRVEDVRHGSGASLGIERTEINRVFAGIVRRARQRPDDRTRRAIGGDAGEESRILHTTAHKSVAHSFQ